MSTEEKRKELWELVKLGIVFVVFLMTTFAVGAIVVEKQNAAANSCPTCTTSVGVQCPWYDVCDLVPLIATVVVGGAIFMICVERFPVRLM